jgi:hypothetical protein
LAEYHPSFQALRGLSMKLGWAGLVFTDVIGQVVPEATVGR